MKQEFILEKKNGEKIKVTCEREGSAVRISLGDHSYNFTAEQLRNSHIQARWLSQQLLITSPRLQGAFELKPAGITPPKESPLAAQHQLAALFPGKVMKILAQEKTWAKPDQLLVVMESMKMEYHYKTSERIFIEKILVREGEVLNKGKPFFEFKKGDSPAVARDNHV